MKTIYVDAAASALKPESVIRAEADFLTNHYSNEGRGICARASYAEKMVADARLTVAEFIGANSSQIVFTGGATDGLNRIPRILELSGAVSKNSIVTVSDLDHHSARLPWEEYAYLGKCKLATCPLNQDFNIDVNRVPFADIFIITSMSNVMGVPQDVKKIVAAARALNPNVITIVDAAQSVAYSNTNVLDWDPDFMCFSAHKIGADTGLGIMYIKDPERWEVDKLGGGMVSSVANRKDRKTNAISEWRLMGGIDKFEAGTLPLTQIAGLTPALRELQDEQLTDKTTQMLHYLRAELSKIPQIKFISPFGAHLLTFVVEGMHVLDFGALMGAHGVCLRVGNMCASWLHALTGHPGTIRISVGSWNTMTEMQEIVRIIKDVIK
ncbi:MAG: aminotransferase class V-fold PLP-dependent enzyme [Alphaproteobacteria bacterium]|nr:aminotransferase class V-fold PLP-dependent enzyme [Alphaproteobacteria bacterium]